jgi:hypothetical protein
MPHHERSTSMVAAAQADDQERAQGRMGQPAPVDVARPVTSLPMGACSNEGAANDVRTLMTCAVCDNDRTMVKGAELKPIPR